MVSGKGARRKGLQFERDIANKLKGIFPDIKRHLESQLQECEGYDLDNAGPFKIQCKKLKKYAPITCLEEIKASGIPALVTQGDRKRAVICFYLDDFIQILNDIGVAYAIE